LNIPYLNIDFDEFEGKEPNACIEIIEKKIEDAVHVTLPK